MNIEIYHLLITITLINLLRFLFLKRSDLFQLNCGIIGYSGKSPYNIDKLNYLLFHNSLERGRHSTGFYTPEQGIVKDALPAEEFLIKNPIKPNNIFIGHVRAATIGSKTKENAHPFEFDNLVGVHNGTLENHYMMMADANQSIKGLPVDSQMLYKLLDEDSKNDPIKYNTLSKFDGAAALLFTDKRDPSKLLIYRDENRPLHFGMIGKDMYISSLAFMLRFIGCTDIKLFATNHLYTIKDGKIIDKVHYPEYVKIRPIYTRQRTLAENARYDDYLSKTDILNNNEGSKTLSQDKKAFLKNISKGVNINNANLKGKWVKWISGRMISYGKKDIFLTLNDWYYVIDYEVSNNYDIMVRDDTFTIVTINKFMVDLTHIDLEDWGVITDNLNYPNDNTKSLFKEGEIVEIEEAKIKIQGNQFIASVFHVGDNKTYNVPLEFIRPATDEEAAKRAEELKALIILPENAIVVEEVNLAKTAEEIANQAEAIQNFMRAVEDQEEEEPSCNKEENPFIGGEELIPMSLFIFALDIIDDGLDELKEIVDTVKALPELGDTLESVIETVHDCYNTDSLAEYYDAEMRGIKNDEVQQEIIIE